MYPAGVDISLLLVHLTFGKQSALGEVCILQGWTISVLFILGNEFRMQVTNPLASDDKELYFLVSTFLCVTI